MKSNFWNHRKFTSNLAQFNPQIRLRVDLLLSTTQSWQNRVEINMAKRQILIGPKSRAVWSDLVPPRARRYAWRRCVVCFRPIFPLFTLVVEMVQNFRKITLGQICNNFFSSDVISFRQSSKKFLLNNSDFFGSVT